MCAMIEKLRIRAGSVRPADVTCPLLTRPATRPPRPLAAPAPPPPRRLPLLLPVPAPPPPRRPPPLSGAFRGEWCDTAHHSARSAPLNGGRRAPFRLLTCA